MEKIGKLGSGSYGIVYHIVNDNQDLAFKRNLSYENESFLNSIRELDILRRLTDHPCIVQLKSISFGKGRDLFSPVSDDDPSIVEGKLHFIFERADMNLGEFVYKYSEYTAEEYYEICKILFLDSLLGLEIMHKSDIIHRDIKCSNILVFNHKNRPCAKICDFGFSKNDSKQYWSTPNTFTPCYRPPEVSMHQKLYGKPSDVWAMGCVLYELFSQKVYLNLEGDTSDSSILKSIIRKLENPLSKSDIKKMRENGYSGRIPKIRGKKLEHNFPDRKTINNFPLMVDLLRLMLTFDDKKRITVTEAINHPYFNDLREKICKIRGYGHIVKDDNYVVKAQYCPERMCMVDIVNKILYEHWAQPYVVLQGIDLFDRYLSSSKEHLSEDESRIYFYVCLYISHKYFNLMEPDIPFREFSGFNGWNKELEEKCFQFEKHLIFDILEFSIYRKTLLDLFDDFDIKLKSRYEIVLNIYFNLHIYDGWNIRDIFREVFL